MLNAARQSLFDGNYSQAIAAYQAVLKRDAKNVDAMTHLGLIVAIGGHADAALETFDKALAIDPKYPPAYLYRGQVLFEQKQDYAGAVKAWESFLKLVPNGRGPRPGGGDAAGREEQAAGALGAPSRRSMIVEPGLQHVHALPEGREIALENLPTLAVVGHSHLDPPELPGDGVVLLLQSLQTPVDLVEVAGDLPEPLVHLRPKRSDPLVDRA